MDYKYLADLLFPDLTMTIDDVEAKYPVRTLSEGAIVTRMAPSPTGFVHLGNLVQGLTAERMAHQSNGILFLRVEDTDAKREVPGAVEVLIETLKHYGISFDEGATIELTGGEYTCDYLININKTITIDGNGSTIKYDGDNEFITPFFYVNRTASNVVIKKY
jgi:glutamyl-tRNA synthetase